PSVVANARTDERADPGAYGLAGLLAPPDAGTTARTSAAIASATGRRCRAIARWLPASAARIALRSSRRPSIWTPLNSRPPLLLMVAPRPPAARAGRRRTRATRRPRRRAARGP